MRKIFAVLIFLLSVPYLYGQQPDTTCYNADIFCTQESIEGIWTLPDPFEPDLPDRICDDTDGQPNNMLYFGFVPNSNTVTFQLNVSGSCTPTNGTSIGYQWGILEGCDLENPEYVICNGDQQVGLSTITSDQFQPGVTYFLYIDGYEGAICDIEIDVLTGLPSIGNPFEVDSITHFTNSLGDFISLGDTLDFCTEGSFVTTAHGSINNNGYIWTSTNNNGSEIITHTSDADTMYMQFTEADSIYQICNQAITDCGDSELACFYVNVISIPNDSCGILEICSADLTLGVNPPCWDGPDLFSPGQHVYTITDTITGCTHDQIIRIVENEISIENKDTLICGIDTMFYNGDTITGDFFEKQYRFEGASVNGCDSLLNLIVERVRFYGQLSELTCLDNNQFGLELEIDSIFPTDYETIVIDWFKDGTFFKTGMPDDLELILDQTGLYSAQVNIFKHGDHCIFDLEGVDIDRFISAGFTVSSDSICISDSIVVTLDEFNIAATYNWIGGDDILEVFPGVYKISWAKSGYYDLSLNVDYQNCEVLSDTLNIYVENLLDTPTVYCMESSNDSIYIEWDQVDCSTQYEIWLDGVYQTSVLDQNYVFYNLEDGTAYEISIVALSDCLCPSSSATTVCSTDDCPDNVEIIFDQLPMNLCWDEFNSDTTLTAIVTGSTGGSMEWSGDIIDNNGLIAHEGIKAGQHLISLTYEVDNCIYQHSETFTLYEEVVFDAEIQDISCFYNNDGSISVFPTQGTAPFNLQMDGNTLSSFDTSGLSDGIYELTISDANDCIASMQVEIVRPSKPEIIINGDTFIERGQTYVYELALENIEYDSVVWYVPTLDSILCTGLCDEISYAPEFDQDLCIEIFYDDQCSMDTCIQLVVNRDVNVIVPNAFTPGNDGLNDYFMVKTNAYYELELITFDVYDRWGGLLFHKANTLISSQTNESAGWDGTTNGQEALPGVYIYYIEIEDTEGNNLRYFGDITLIRD